MKDQDLQSLIKQVFELSPSAQNDLIKAIIFYRNEEPLTEKEKQFINLSEEHIKKLKEANAKLDKVINKFE